MKKNNHNIQLWQIKLVHLAAKQLDLIWDTERLKQESEAIDPYHKLLSNFTGKNNSPAASSKELNYDQANLLLKQFEKLGFNSTAKKENQFESRFTDNRPAKFASKKQLGMLLGLWTEHSNAKTFESLNTFIKRITKVDNIEWLLKKDVNKMVEAIKRLK